MRGPISFLLPPAFGLVGDEPLAPHHPLASLLAQIMEAGDPLSYAPHVFGEPLLPGRSRPAVLVTYALDDEVLPNIATHGLIRALGIPVVGTTLREQPLIEQTAAPASGNLGGLTAGAVEYAPANHALGYMRWDTKEYFPDLPLEDAEEPFPALPRSFRFEIPIREHSDQVVHFFRTALAGAAEIKVTAPPKSDFDADGVLDADELAGGTDPYDPESK
jgi:hypothetical protein